MMHFDKFLTKPQVEDSEEFAAFETWYGVPFKDYYNEVRKEERIFAARKAKIMENRYCIDDFLD